MEIQPDPMENGEISFGRFRLDLRRPELRRDGQRVRIHRRALGILCALAEAKGEIVSRDELMARLWPGRIVRRDKLGRGHDLTAITVRWFPYRRGPSSGVRIDEISAHRDVLTGTPDRAAWTRGGILFLAYHPILEQLLVAFR